MKKYFCIILAMFIGNVFAQNNQLPTKLIKLVKQSLKSYPKIGEMQQQVCLGEVKVELMKAGYLPVITSDVSYRRLYPTTSFSFPIGSGQYKSLQFSTTDNYSISLNVNQPMVDLKTSASIGKAKSDLVTASDNLENYNTQVAYQVAQLYYGIIFLNKSIIVQQQQLDLLKSNILLTNSKLENGDALKFDLVSTQVMYTNAENRYAELNSQLHKQYILLKTFTGIENESIDDTLIDSRKFNLITDSILAISLTHNLDVKVVNDKKTSANWDQIAADRSRWPTLYLNSSVGYKNGYSPNLESLRFNYFVGFGLSIPIMSGYRPGIQKKMAEINMKATLLSIEHQKLMLTRDVSNALEDISKLLKLLSGSDTQVYQAKLALELASERHKNGVVTNLEFLTAQMNFQDALLSKLQFEYNLLLSRMELCRLSGDKWW